MKDDRIVVNLNVQSLGPSSLLGSVVNAMDKLEDPELGTVQVIISGELSTEVNMGRSLRMNLLADNLKELSSWLEKRQNQRQGVVSLWFASVE